MNRKPGIDPRSLAMMLAIGALEVSIVVLWLMKDAEVATALAWITR